MSVEVRILDRQIPVGVKNFKAALLFLFVGVLVGKELLQERDGIKVIVGDLGVLEDDGGAKVPAAVFGGMVPRDLSEDLEDAAHLDFLFQHGIVVFLEQGDKFVGVPPFDFVVVLDDVGLVICALLLRCVGLRLQSVGDWESDDCDEREYKRSEQTRATGNGDVHPILRVYLGARMLLSSVRGRSSFSRMENEVSLNETGHVA